LILFFQDSRGEDTQSVSDYHPPLPLPSSPHPQRSQRGKDDQPSVVNLTLLYKNSEAVLPANTGIQPKNTGFRVKPGMTNYTKTFLNHYTSKPKNNAYIESFNGKFQGMNALTNTGFTIFRMPNRKLRP